MGKKTSTAEDIIEITAKFPWWVGGILALISYFSLHALAGKEYQAAGQDLGQTVSGSMIYVAATFGQYVLPALFTIGAIASLIGNIKRKKLYEDVTTSKKALEDISWHQFELLIGEYFRHEGYQVKETGPGADGGVDLILHKDDAKYLVQCKHWKAYKVGVKPVRELLGVMAGSGAAGGYVITSGQFTRDAVKFARENNIEMIDGKALEKILGSKNLAAGAVQKFASTQPPHKAGLQNSQTDPVCPKCGNPMVLRTAKKGARAGQQFWGCSKFPACRSTMPLN